MGAKDIKKQLDELRFMTMEEFSQRTTYTSETVRKMCERGEIETVKLGKGNRGKRVIPVSFFLKFVKGKE